MSVRPKKGFYGRCGICGEFKIMTRDHDHKTLLVRGLLCWVCNQRLACIEHNLQAKSKKNYLRWETQFRVEIKQWLSRSTTLRYNRNAKHQIPLLLKSSAAEWQANAPQR